MGGEEGRAAEPGLGNLLERLIGDLRGVVHAEVDLLQTTYWLRFRGIFKSLAVIVAGAILCLAAVAALLMGLVLGLAAIIGPFVAALVVGGGGLVLGVVIVMIAARRIDRQVSMLPIDADPGLGSANDD